MVDIETNTRLSLNTEGDAGSYLMVPLPQLPDVRRVLQQNGIEFAIAEDAIQLDGKAVIAIVDFGHSADAARIQAALDAA